MAQVNYLTPPLEEKDLVYKLARHFSEKTRVAAVTRGVNTIEEFIMVIDECQDLVRDLHRTQVKVENPYPRAQEKQRKPWYKPPTQENQNKERRNRSGDRNDYQKGKICAQLWLIKLTHNRLPVRRRRRETSSRYR